MNETMKRILLSLLLMLPLINAVSQESPQVAALRTPNLTTVQMSDQEAEFMRFLYAYMPMADVTDYTVEYHLENVRATLEAREQMPWGKTVPELLFKHFVLPLRVNNEALDLSRPVFYRELKERVQGMTMEEAILEVNHWCHEHVTYQPSDSRTLSPLACMNTAIGRCGEESTFTVAALRSIGIPARQVYTPRWAHTDDNHAWVEAWANGRWHFLGACEPEAVLDLGWFNAPASRALLMHTRAFGDYQGPEEVMSRTRNFTEINLIGNYAATARDQVQVLDRSGNPVPGARVEFRIYNYAEFYPAATKTADGKGRASLTAGRGDMLVWASLVHSSLLIGRIYSSIIQFKIVLFPEEYNFKTAILTFLSLFINSIKSSYPLIIVLIKSFFSNWSNLSIISFKTFILFEEYLKSFIFFIFLFDSFLVNLFINSCNNLS